jgi:hypothetical protein
MNFDMTNPNNRWTVRLEVLTAVKMLVFWVVRLCRLAFWRNIFRAEVGSSMFL